MANKGILRSPEFRKILRKIGQADIGCTFPGAQTLILEYETEGEKAIVEAMVSILKKLDAGNELNISCKRVGGD